MPPRQPKAVIARVEPGSIAAELGLQPGDVVKAVGGQPVRDMLDWQFLTTAEDLELTVEHAGEEQLIQLEKDFDAELGVSFGEHSTFDGVYTCVNKCVFCFVHQTPRGMRRSLYLMDDDYRLSFMHGNFVTLVGISQDKWQRIIDQRISPIYVSVHATDDDLRVRLMGTEKARGVMGKLRELAAHGIGFHTQIVACPGLNDGPALDRSIADLAALWPHCRSIAVVPVGLTRHREGLYELSPYDRAGARQMLDQVEPYRQRSLAAHDTRLVWCSDEFYVIAGRELPGAESYEGYPQLENGLGVIRLFTDEFAALAPRLPAALPARRRVTVVTGTCAEGTLTPAICRLNEIDNLQVDLAVVRNDFFGHTVTVAGLLTGQDIIAQLRLRGDLGDLVLIPGEAVRDGDDMLIDDLRLSDLTQALAVNVIPATSANDLTEHACGMPLPKIKKGRASRHRAVAKATGVAEKLGKYGKLS